MAAYTHRHLPHWQIVGGVYFLTFRLAGSLPEEVENRLREDARRLKYLSETPNLRKRVDKQLFAMVEKHLADACCSGSGPLFLARADCATTIKDSLDFGAPNKRYIPHRFCIMPNHVHLLLEPLPVDVPANYSFEPGWEHYCERRRISSTLELEKQECQSYHGMSQIMKSIKGSTARRINQLIDGKGAVWQDESFDHWIRDAEEYERVVKYIDDNPVVARLCTSATEWRWSTAGEQKVN